MLQRVNSAYEAEKDSLKREYNSLNQELSSRDVIISSSEREFLKLQFEKNTLADELQKLVKSKKGKVSHSLIAETTTEFETTAPTRIERDTANAIVIYKGQYKDEYVEWDGTAGPDSFLVHVFIENRYEYSQVVRNPLFKPASIRAEWFNTNPYTRTKDLLSQDIEVPLDKFVLSLGFTSGVEIPTLRTTTVLGVHAGIKVLGVK